MAKFLWIYNSHNSLGKYFIKTSYCVPGMVAQDKEYISEQNQQGLSP